MLGGYALFAILIIFITYTAIWTGDCSLRCLPGRHGSAAVHIQPSSQNGPPVRNQFVTTVCNCEPCPCSLIDNYVVPATRECMRRADSVSQYFTGRTDMLSQFYGWMSENTSARRLAQVVNEAKSSIYSDSIGEFTMVDNPYFGKQRAICVAPARTAEEESMMMPSVSGVTKIGSEVIQKLTEITSLEPEKIIAPTKLKSRSDTSSLPSKQTSRLKELEETLDPEKNCSKCVEQGKTCIRGCPSADKKRKKLKK